MTEEHFFADDITIGDEDYKLIKSRGTGVRNGSGFVILYQDGSYYVGIRLPLSDFFEKRIVTTRPDWALRAFNKIEYKDTTQELWDKIGLTEA